MVSDKEQNCETLCVCVCVCGMVEMYNVHMAVSIL